MSASLMSSRYGCSIPNAPIPRADILLEVLIASALGVVVGWVLFLLIKPKGKPTTPSQLGRLWMAWWAIAIYGTFIGKAYVDGLARSEIFIVYFVAALFLLLCAYVGGWTYGRAFKFRAKLAVAKTGADEVIYEAVMKELEGSEKRGGVWAKALAEADGDESKAKARYIQYRVRQIKVEKKG